MHSAFKLLPSTELKRKRRSDEDSTGDSENKRHVKRPATEQSITYTRNIPNYLRNFSQPLTPDDSSDDEPMTCEPDPWSQHGAFGDDAMRLSSSSMSSLQANFNDSDNDVDMILPFPRLRRSPESIIAAPPPSPYLSASSVQSDQRILTPTASNFGPSDTPSRTSYARHNHLPQYTILSPVMYEETGPPSPITSLDTPTQMAMESASNGFSGLSVVCQDDNVSISDNQFNEARMHDLHQINPRKNGKTARLHMGFRADCEKCIQRVPGHYSHILWS